MPASSSWPAEPPPADSGRDWMRLDSGPPAPARRPPPADPAVLPPGYELLEDLGPGDHGAAFKARQTGSNQIVAVRFVNAPAPDQLADLEHPNIAKLIDRGAHDGREFIAFEFVEGPSLAAWLARIPPSAHQSAAVVRDLARGVHLAHLHGLVHGRLRPSRVLLRFLAETCDPLLGFAPVLTDIGLPVADAAALNPLYAAPEHCGAPAVKPRPTSDVYGLGAILYEMLTGRRPFEGSSVNETVLLARTLEPVPPRRLRPAIPVDLETICLKCLEKDPRRRYDGAEQLADDLTRFLNDQPIVARPIGLARRVWRWRRHHGRRADLLLLAAAIVLALAVIGPLAAVWFALQGGQP